MVSGQATHFHSWAQLKGFIEQVLSGTLAEPSETTPPARRKR
jgi:hypothetical protein